MDPIENALEFQLRLEAIAATRGEVSEHTKARIQAARAERRAAIIEDLLTPPMLFMCAVLGAVAMFIGRFVHFLHAGDDLAYQSMVLQSVLGVIVLLVIRTALLIRERKYDVALGLGFVLMLTCMHNLVWLWPRLFAAIFSRDYVVAVEEVTEPGSLFLWVLSVPFMAV